MMFLHLPSSLDSAMWYLGKVVPSTPYQICVYVSTKLIMGDILCGAKLQETSNPKDYVWK